jgi:transposase
MFEFFGGVPEVIVCDNLKSAVTKASRTEPKVHPAYQHLAEHYGTLILPARPRKPKDKAKVEGAVLIVERWILFRLRKRVFTSLVELNEAIQVLLKDLNNRPFQKLPGSRRSQFEAIDRPALNPLPVQTFEYTEFRKVRIGLDGCFDVDGCTYSAPFTLCRQMVELRITAATVEILHQGRRLASHARSTGTTPVIDPQHLQATDRHFGLWQADHELAWAATIGPNTQAFLVVLFAASKIKEQGYRTAGALKRLEREFGDERLEAGCTRAVHIGANSLSSLRSILRTGLDQQRAPDAEHQEAAFDHPNVRGPHYYH